MKVKKEKIKRILAFLLAEILVFGTCLTVNPYTVMATGVGSTEGATEGSAEGSTVSSTKKLYVKVESVSSGILTEDVPLQKLTFSLGVSDISVTVDEQTHDSGITYEDTLTIPEGEIPFTSDNYTGTLMSSSSLTDTENGDGQILTVSVNAVTPKLGNISGLDSIKTVTETSFSLSNNVWNSKARWSIADDNNSAEATVTPIEAGGCKVTANKGTKGSTERSFKLKATVGDASVGETSVEKTVTVTRKTTSLCITSTPSDVNGISWKNDVQVRFRLKSDEDTELRNQEIDYKIYYGTSLNTSETWTTGSNTPVTVNLSRKVKEVKITASYGDDDDTYAGADATPLVYNPNKENNDTAVNFDGEYTENAPLELTYGTAAVSKGITLWHNSEQLDSNSENGNAEVIADFDRITKESFSIEQGTGNTLVFTPLKACTSPVKVDLHLESDNYTFNKTIYVKVNPYPLSIVSAAVSQPKIYNANDKVDVVAVLSVEADLIVSDEEKAQFASVIFSDYSSGKIDVVGVNEEQSFTFSPSDLTNTPLTGVMKNNYTIKTGSKDEDVKLTIVKRSLVLKVADTSRPFRSLSYTCDGKDIQNLVSIQAATEDTGIIGTNPTTLEGFAFPTVVDTTATNLNADNVKINDQATFGDHNQALILNFDNSNPTGNYTFDTVGYAKGKLQITEETNVSSYVAVDNTNSIHVFETTARERYYGKDATVKFKLGGDYNRIYLASGSDISSSLALESMLTSGAVKTIKVYLQREENNSVKAKSETFDISFKYDDIDPTCDEIKFNVNNKVVSDLASAITFGIYDNKKIEAQIMVGDNLSGVRGWSYYVADITEDNSFKGLLTDNDYKEALVNSNFIAGTDDGKIKVGTLSEGQALEEGNNYIVFVKVVDNVGNVKIYGSNGIVLENFHDISIGFTETARDENVSKGTWDDISYYAGDIDLTLTAEEDASESKYYSGLDYMEYTISTHYGDGTTKTDTKKEDQEKPKDKTFSELKEYCTIEKTLTFTDNPTKSQMITVSALAADNAGNTMNQNEPATRTFILDSIAPEIVTSTFTQVNNDGAFLNISYANSDVTYTVAIKERFLKELTVVLNGENYTLAELDAQKETLGIASVTMDPAADIRSATDETVYNFSIVFTEDGNYDVCTVAVDAAGNETSDDGFAFTIDTVLPELEVTYTAHYKDGSASVVDTTNGRAYADETVSYVTVTAVIKETNFAAKGGSIEYAAYNSKNEPVEIPNYDKAFKGDPEGEGFRWADTGDVSMTDKRRVMELALPVINIDANYAFAFSFTDLAGNSLAADPVHEITLDTVRPTAKLTVTDLVAGGSKGKMSWTLLLNKLTFGLFGKNQVVVSMTSDDVTAGVNTTEYIITSDLRTLDQLKTETAWNPYKDDLTLKNNQDYVVYEKVVDKAGNTEYFSTDRIIVDAVDPKPEVTIKPTVPGWGKDVYSATDKPGFDVDVIDPINNDSYAGLKEITYTIKNGTTGFVESGTLASYKAADHTQEYTGHVNIDPAKFYSNDVQVTVEANDYSTNDATTETISIKVDNQEPKVNFTFDTSDASNGKYYNKEKRLTITVDERNFDDTYKPEVTSSTGNGWSFSGWTHNGETHTGTVTFSGDADYTVSYFCYDLAGNKSETVTMDEITIDKTKPVIAVIYNNNSVLNNSYYKESRTATITITEHNFNPADVTVTTTARLDGATVAVPGVSGWSGGGDTHTATISYAADADYTFTISTTDMASNVSDPYDTESFTVDMTQPAVEITAIEDKSANNGVVAPVITLEDINFDRNNVVVRLCGVNKGAVDTAGMYTVANSAKGQVITFADFGKNMDDIYTLTAEATDMAGNTFSTSKTFSVNRDGSTYMYEEYTEDLINKGYTHDPKDIVVTEVNVDTLTFRELTLSKNGTQLTLAEGTDYEVLASGSEVSWKSYTYTIKASNFEDEGEYAISIYSEDRAANKTTNTSKKKDITFIVDKTSPVISVSNIEDGGRYKADSQAFIANVDDNMALDKVEYYLDGEMKQSFTADEVAEVNGELNLTVGSSNKFQKVIIKAYDKAENEPTEAKLNILVTTNAFVQYYNNKPVFYGSIGGGVVLIGGAVVAGIHFSGEKKDKQKKN